MKEREREGREGEREREGKKLGKGGTNVREEIIRVINGSARGD